jgi:uncharacterized protein YbjT (DUF2867 family)
MTRDPAAEAALKLKALPGVTLVRGDACDPTSLRRAFSGVEAVFMSCSNFEGQVQAEKNLINAAAASPTCTYLVKLGTCDVAGYTAANSPVEYGKYHAEIIAHLERSSLQWTVLNPNKFMQNHMLDSRTLSQNQIRWPIPATAPCTLVDTRDIGELAAALLQLQERSAHVSQKYNVCGPESHTTVDLAQMYSKTLGRKITPVQVSREAWAKDAEEVGFPAWLANAVSIAICDFWGKAKLNHSSSANVLALCPPKRTMQQWITEHAPHFPKPKA